MARFSEYLDYDYLPGDIRFAGLSEYRQRPQEVTDYLAEKKFLFIPEKNRGKRLQTFLALQNNPEALLTQTLNLPSNFESLLALSRSGT